MRVNFWLKAWGEGNIGFHQADVHPALPKYWPELPAGASVLVPLCGKSLDLLWLEQLGLEVIGVEFVESAVVDFFNENNLSFEESVQYGHRCLRASERDISIFVTDFIQFANDYSGPPMASLYDRGALIALPFDMRPGYVEACKKLLVSSPQGLLVSLTYEPLAMEGPPFSVEDGEVERLWIGQVARAETVDVLSSMRRAVAAGVTSLEEHYWIFTPSGKSSPQEPLPHR